MALVYEVDTVIKTLKFYLDYDSVGKDLGVSF